MRLVNGRDEAVPWNGLIVRYHSLGYRQPIGSHLDRAGHPLGYLLYDSAALYLPVRDCWIGWPHEIRQPLERVGAASPLPSVSPGCVQCLASKVLGLSLRQLAAD